jgi:hypothetical protein
MSPAPNGQQKVAVITGASQGIGAGLVAAFRQAGYAVVGTARSITSCDDTDFLTVHGDIAHVETAQRVLDRRKGDSAAVVRRTRIESPRVARVLEAQGDANGDPNAVGRPHTRSDLGEPISSSEEPWRFLSILVGRGVGIIHWFVDVDPSSNEIRVHQFRIRAPVERPSCASVGTAARSSNLACRPLDLMS